ncbi:MAG: hypothetical protein GY852_06505, partial [bacterium]|nr:hypothetical protein [bacterium]
LETRLEKHGKLFMGEVRSFVKSLFDRGKATAVEYGNKEDLEILAAPRYVFLSMDDDPETQEMKLDAISNFCIPGAESDLAFLDTMKRKFFQHVPVSEAEENRLKEMEQNQSYSRYFRTITE